MLNLPKDENEPISLNLFPHSQDFEAGGGRIRPGMASIVVALDGSGDCDTIQDGIRRLPNAGGTVYIKEGIYQTKAPILITRDNVVLIGAGKSTKIINSVDNGIEILSSASFVQIKEMFIQANTTGILINGGSNITLEHLWIYDCPVYAIHIPATNEGTRIHNCKISNVEIGIYTEDALDAAFIMSNTITTTTNAIYGVFANCVIMDNVLDTCSSDGIYFTDADCDSNMIANNKFKTMTADAIHIQDAGATKNIILGNAYIGFTVTDNGIGTIIEHNQT